MTSTTLPVLAVDAVEASAVVDNTVTAGQQALATDILALHAWPATHVARITPSLAA